MDKAFVFDFDDTLANTFCKVLVRHCVTHEPIKTLSPSEFNEYELGGNEYYDFCEFRDEIFIHNAEPTHLIHLAKEVYEEGHKVYILTAREDNVCDAIHTWLIKYGISAHVICVGGTSSTIPVLKRKILLTIMEGVDKMYFYDDSEENVNNVPKHEKIRAYRV